jgi:phosphopentomutase
VIYVFTMFSKNKFRTETGRGINQVVFVYFNQTDSAYQHRQDMASSSSSSSLVSQYVLEAWSMLDWGC